MTASTYLFNVDTIRPLAADLVQRLAGRLAFDLSTDGIVCAGEEALAVWRRRHIVSEARPSTSVASSLRLNSAGSRYAGIRIPGHRATASRRSRALGRCCTHLGLEL